MSCAAVGVPFLDAMSCPGMAEMSWPVIGGATADGVDAAALAAARGCASASSGAASGARTNVVRASVNRGFIGCRRGMTNAEPGRRFSVRHPPAQRTASAAIRSKWTLERRGQKWGDAADTDWIDRLRVGDAHEARRFRGHCRGGTTRRGGAALGLGRRCLGAVPMMHLRSSLVVRRSDVMVRWQRAGDHRRC